MTRLFIACGGRQPLPGERRDQSNPDLRRGAEDLPAPTLGASLSTNFAGPSAASVVERAGDFLRRGE